MPEYTTRTHRKGLKIWNFAHRTAFIYQISMNPWEWTAAAA